MSVHTEYILILSVFLLSFIQVQPNGNDCGLIAVAFALAILGGQAPEEMFFNVHQMRGHLCSCLSRGR